LSRLFSVIKNRQSRAELCSIYNTIGRLDSKYEELSQLVSDLNSWDPKRLEEPDYMRRLDAYKRLNQIVNDWSEFDIKLGSVLLYNCFYFMNEVEDIALKESSTNSIQIFVKKSAELELSKSERYLFEANFVSELKNGLKNKNENARHEFINVLIDFIKSFKVIFSSLNELTVLFDSQDIEKDFFENIKHIQLHRRARALARLQRACNENHLSSENLLGYMMPIIRSFLDNEMYHKYDYLIEEACKSIGGVCYILAWSKYYKLLDYYLTCLSKNVLNQKLNIKIIVQVMDAFHFDLTQSKQDDYFTNRKNIDLQDEEEDQEEKESKSKEDLEDEEDKHSEMDENEEEEKTVAVVNLNSVHDNKNARTKQLVGVEMATKIHATITKKILPTLFKCLTKRLRSEGEHKVNKHEDEDEQILRVPMALAILKLLINLPLKTLETHLPGLLFKVCDMLKSRAISVRNTTRECLMKMIDSLPDKKYYYYVFKEMSNCLTRGYQVKINLFYIRLEIISKISVRNFI
jgi:U3 small nucleolar RNA-associated protein 20